MENVSFKLNKKFYSEQAVKTALEDYKEICSGTATSSSDSLSVTLVAKPEVLDSVKDEFCNYVLGIMKNL